MKKALLLIAFIPLAAGTFILTGCPNNSTIAPTSTATPSPQTMAVTTTTSTDNTFGYIYASSSGTNNAAVSGLLSLSAHVGDTIILPGNSTHPLWFDNGTSNCVTIGGTAMSGYTSGPVTYVFPATGTYRFHCGNHGGCTPNDSACGLSTCTAMQGVVTVN